MPPITWGTSLIFPVHFLASIIEVSRSAIEMSFNLNDWAIQNRLKPKTIKILESEDLDMVDDLKLLSVDDIGLLNITLGQKNALKEAVKSLTIGSFDLSRKISRKDEKDLLFYQSNTTQKW